MIARLILMNMVMAALIAARAIERSLPPRHVGRFVAEGLELFDSLALPLAVAVGIIGIVMMTTQVAPSWVRYLTWGFTVLAAALLAVEFLTSVVGALVVGFALAQ